MKARLWILLTALSLPAVPAVADPIDSSGTVSEGETLRYRWRLKGVGGIVATLLPTYPNAGYGVLQSAADGSSRLVSEFLATSEKAAAGHHWMFRSELDLENSRTLRVEERLVFHGKKRESEHELRGRPGIDLLSGLQLLRRSPPLAPRRQSIWSDGKLYQVLVTPDRHPVVRRIGGQQVTLRHLSIRGVKAPGEPFWKGVGEIWLTDDGRALPVEIRLRRKFGQLQLDLLEPLPSPPSLAGEVSGRDSRSQSSTERNAPSGRGD